MNRVYKRGGLARRDKLSSLRAFLSLSLFRGEGRVRRKSFSSSPQIASALWLSRTLFSLHFNGARNILQTIKSHPPRIHTRINIPEKLISANYSPSTSEIRQKTKPTANTPAIKKKRSTLNLCWWKSSRGSEADSDLSIIVARSTTMLIRANGHCDLTRGVRWKEAVRDKKARPCRVLHLPRKC